MLAGRRRFVFIPLALFALFVIGYKYGLGIHRTLSYASRPLWDHPDGPHTVIPHYHAEGLHITADVCALHGWPARDAAVASKIEAWDAVLFSGELDLLEIRLNELDGAVDKFFIMESNRTFTGLPKPLTFQENRARFSGFEHKIVYEALLGPSAEESGETDPWVWEAHQRGSMSNLLRATLPSTSTPPIVLFSDVDEIPSEHTLRLLKACAFGGPLHLQMLSYLYSFEWPIGWSSWRAQVHEWDNGRTYYRHSMASDVALADAGWHCSYCFRHLDDFVAKMQGFSHADRLQGDLSLLTHKHIQDVVCRGVDIFGMLPEAYSYKEMLQLLQPEPSKSMTGIPKFLIEHGERFSFLLPGGCHREP